MFANLKDYFGEDIVVVRPEGCSDFVGFRATIGKTIRFAQLTDTQETDRAVDMIVGQI